MSVLQPQQVAILSRASRRAGLLTLLGALMVLGTLVYSSVKLASVTNQVHDKQAELVQLQQQDGAIRAQLLSHKTEDDTVTQDLAALRQQMQALRAEKTSLENSGNALRSQTNTYLTSIRELSSEVAKSADQGLNSAVQRLTPVSAAVQPRANAVLETGLKTPDGRQIYKYSLWLEAPPAEKAKIARVSYFFNHPTFIHKTQASSNPEEGFRISYNGWGCLSSVIITLALKNGPEQKIDFNMCGALD